MLLFSLLDTKLGRALAGVFLLYIAYLWLNVWLSTQKADAVNAKVQLINESTKNQVRIDAQIAKETIDTATHGMRARAAERLQQYQASRGDRLQRISPGKGATDGNRGSVNMVGPAVLSDTEIAQIFKYSELLQ